MERKVVVTGMGIWSCLGTDLDTVKQSLYEGKSGIGIQPERLTYGYRSALTGIVAEPVITKKMLDRQLDMLICQACRLLNKLEFLMSIFLIMR